MKTLFSIKNESDAGVQKVLSIRAGAKHCSFSIASKSGAEIYNLAYVAMDDWNEKERSELFEAYPELGGLFYEVLIAYDFPESSLVPIKSVHNDDPGTILKALYGINNLYSFISESLSGWQLNNFYAVPVFLKDWFQHKFPSARYWHQYTIGLRHSISTYTGGTLLVDLRKDDFVVIVTGSNNILLAQTYEYSTPEDVLYYLLKICKRFSLSQEEVQLQISGLVDKQSALYKELYQYFINIAFRDATWNTTPDHPAHFFTSLNDLALCVS